MKKIISIGLILGLCLSVVGCSNKLSDEDMEKYIDYESSVNKVLLESNVINDRIQEYTEEFIDPNMEWVIDDRVSKLNGFENSFVEMNEKLNSVNSKKLEVFYDNCTEYRGTTKKDENDNYEKLKNSIFEIRRNIAYDTEIINLMKDGNLTSDEYSQVKYFLKLQERHIDEKIIEMLPSEYSDNDVQLQNEIYKKYNIQMEE